MEDFKYDITLNAGSNNEKKIKFLRSLQILPWGNLATRHADTEWISYRGSLYALKL
jgi:hypothetical protein